MTKSDHFALELRQASKTFGTAGLALDQVNLAVRPGEMVALLGASGSGKSTLLRCVCGLEKLDATGGSVHLQGRTLQSDGRLSPEVRELRQHTALIFQQFNLVGRISLLVNVLTGLLPHVPVWRSLLGRFTAGERLVALQALDAVGLSAQALQRASTLSGGQQQRGAIARALVQGAQLLLADEPVASLDPESTRMVMDLLQSLNQSRGMTVVLSLHNVDLARKYCTRTVALRQGRLVYDGPSSGLDAQRLKQLYGAQHQELTGHEALGQAPELAQPWAAAT
jgi:phosphonate transport system ATP-binding protein